MALGKQAKILSDKQVRAVLAELDTWRYPLRDRVIFLFSIKAGMRSKRGLSAGAVTVWFHRLFASQDGRSRRKPS